MKTSSRVSTSFALSEWLVVHYYVVAMGLCYGDVVVRQISKQFLGCFGWFLVGCSGVLGGC